MKVAQNDETNPSTRSIHLSDASSMLNMEHSPSGHLSDTGPVPGIPFRLFPPFTYTVQHYVRTPLASLIVMLCICLCVFTVSSPSSLR